MEKPPWKIENNPKTQIAASLALLATGFFSVWLCRNAPFDFSEVNEITAGLLLGGMLIISGIGGMLFSGKSVIVVNPETREIVIENSNRFGKKLNKIPFDRIRKTFVSTLGSGGDEYGTFYVGLALRDGKDFPLFVGIFDGIWDEPSANEKKRRLDSLLEIR